MVAYILYICDKENRPQVLSQGPAVLIYMIEYKEIVKRFFYERVELCSFVARLPSSEEWAEISGFYRKLAENACTWFCDVFCERCRVEYESDTDPDKRFGRKVYRYTLKFFVNELESGFLEIRCEVTLKRGRNETVSTYMERHLWNKETRLLIREKKDTNKNRLPKGKRLKDIYLG